MAQQDCCSLVLNSLPYPLWVVLATVTSGTGICYLAQWVFSTVEMLQALLIRRYE